MVESPKQLETFALDRFKLVRKVPYFAPLVYLHPPIITQGVEIAAVDQHGRIYLGPKYFTLPLEQRLGVLLHELAHLFLRHFERRASRDATRWNVAADLAINPIVVEYGFSLPDGALHPSPFGLPEDQTAEWYYAKLPKVNVAPASDGGSASDGIRRQWEKPVEADEPERGVLSGRNSDVHRNTALAEAAAKVAGSSGAPAIFRQFAEATAPRVSWQDRLRGIISSVRYYRGETQHVGWQESRVWSGVYRAQYRPVLPECHCLIDTSGSIGESELSEAIAILRDSRIFTMVHWGDEKLRASQSIHETLKPVGGGGTNMPAVLDEIRRRYPRVQHIVCITDTYSTWKKLDSRGLTILTSTNPPQVPEWLLPQTIVIEGVNV